MRAIPRLVNFGRLCLDAFEKATIQEVVGGRGEGGQVSRRFPRSREGLVERRFPPSTVPAIG